MNSIIIGISGKRKRGKDKVASLIKSFLNSYYGNIPSTEIDHFAFPIKESCRIIFGFVFDQINGDSKEKIDEYWNITPRKIFQDYGMLMREKLGKDIWVKSLGKRIKKSKKNIVISDLRFKNELEMLRECNAYLIRINRNVPYDSKIDDHQSEIDLDDYNGWDYTIENDGGIRELKFKVNSILVDILEKKNNKQT